MGMFDNIRCKWPLPVSGANELDYQTKDTPNQSLDNYEIREDGTLWIEEYDVENRSEAAKWKKDHPGEEVPEELKGWKSFIGCLTRINKRWVQVTDFTGEVAFYTLCDTKDGKVVNADERAGWIEWSAYFIKGKLNSVNLIKNREKEQ
jgi:hypothetical protein